MFPVSGGAAFRVSEEDLHRPVSRPQSGISLRPTWSFQRLLAFSGDLEGESLELF